jgi:hypothetical protein
LTLLREESEGGLHPENLKRYLSTAEDKTERIAVKVGGKRRVRTALDQM